MFSLLISIREFIFSPTSLPNFSNEFDLLKISIVTAVYNSEKTISDAIASVVRQSSPAEHVVIDGMSNDGTKQIIAANSDKISKTVREPDNGIYDALNKGIAYSTGDIIGFLHADDLLADEMTLQRVQNKFASGDFDAVYGDLTYVDANNTEKIIRYWKSNEFNRQKFRRGWMPPHPTVYIRKNIYQEFGGYRTDLGSAADYECMIRLMYHHKIRVGYIPKVQVKMRVGGESNASVKNRLSANQADRQAWRENGLQPPWGLRFTKPLSKLPQYWQRPDDSTNHR